MTGRSTGITIYSLDYLVNLVNFVYLAYLVYLGRGSGEMWKCASCHCCPATRHQFLSTALPPAMKSTKESRQAITAAASGEGLRTLGMNCMSNGLWLSGIQTDPVLVLALRLHAMKLAEQSAVFICCSTHSGLCRIAVYAPSYCETHCTKSTLAWLFNSLLPY